MIDGALRTRVTQYPAIAIREIIGNVLIHQDFTVTGTGPVVEIFENRMEATNPGEPLIDIYRIVDNPPCSRNEKLASLLRRLHICEELGTGWDKIVISCESRKLPAPKITPYENATKVTLFAEMPFSNISLKDKFWALYLHACICYSADGEGITNASLRQRFGLEVSASASISRLIRDAVDGGFIKPLDPHTAPRYMRYIPFWG